MRMGWECWIQCGNLKYYTLDRGTSRRGTYFSAGSAFEFRLLISVKAWVSTWIAILLSHFHRVLPFQAAPPILVVRMLYQFAHSFYVKHVCTNGIRSWFWVLRRYEIITYSSTWDPVVEIRVGNFDHDFKWTIWFTEQIGSILRRWASTSS
jgi:hypothetical protein